MARKKAVVDNRIAEADIDRGVLVVLTGNGKGKSSSAFGMALRSLGHGMSVGIVQFIKARETGEGRFLRELPNVSYHVMGEGFTWETQDRERDTRAAMAAWAQAAALLGEDGPDLVVLDELNIALKQGLVDLDEVLAALAARPPMQHVVITGRGAPDALIEAADTVTELGSVKHAFQAGVKAQKGVEW
jgi:cob(I)alamin adenosyltransferase